MNTETQERHKNKDQNSEIFKWFVAQIIKENCHLLEPIGLVFSHPSLKIASIKWDKQQRSAELKKKKIILRLTVLGFE